MKITVDCFTDCSVGLNDLTLFEAMPSGGFLLLLANGRDHAFSSGGFQPIIDLVKETFSISLRKSSGATESRLSQAAIAVEHAIIDRFPSSTKYWGEEDYSAVFLAVVVEEGYAHSAWIGSPQAILFRNGQCVHETLPHVNVIQDQLDFVITAKTLSTRSGAPKFQVQTNEPWKLKHMDTLVIADYRLFAMAKSEDILELITTENAFPARRLVEWCQGRKFRFAQSALVARF